jgi:hypothetical protein
VLDARAARFSPLADVLTFLRLITFGGLLDSSTEAKQ